ncbi:MAG: Lysyl-tRNA synthetase (class II) [uncultured Chloroflexi bacterium]|uniref:Lysine--tRNA ligase n=1 Tax=uncultured Chloroflexota bacterium TaxID=166587 RepID=A0A6J4IL33_9CHLR|nr:MAG: Lysyl-tRNA synthetase (class II) [uncultured Chloroflexota bacterium]
MTDETGAVAGAESTMAADIPLAEYRNRRLEKVQALRALGIDPYPSLTKRTHQAQAVADGFDSLDGQRVSVAGRLMSLRTQGALSFAHVQDQSGRIQLFIRRNVLGELDAARGSVGYEHIKLLDIGDIVEASGTVMRTQRGEVSVLTDGLRLLTKSLRPLPDKWHGVRDRETIVRRRYLDTIMAPERRAPFEQVAQLLVTVRGFLHQRGFQEFHTPVLQPQYGGGTAKPFTTYVNALDADVFLAISHELYLKRLVVAGFEKVFTIGRYFRNEGIDRSHNPEFSMVETMTAFENYEYNMQLIEDLFRTVARDCFKRSTFQVRGHEVSFDAPWQRIAMADAVQRETGLDFRAMRTLDEANGALASLGVRAPEPSIGHALVRAFELRVEETLIQPTIVYGHPMEISPLAKASAEDPRYAERFEFFIGGTECGDNWTEQNDPVALLERWKAARATRVANEDDEPPPPDYDFLEALEYGMAPTTGIGPGIERMAMIFTEQENIDEVLFFPMARPSISTVNAAIYGADASSTANPLPAGAALTLDELETLLADGVLRPVRGRVKVYPHLVLWPRQGNGGRRHASGYVELEGFAESGRWRVPVRSATAAEVIDVKKEAQALLETVKQRLVEPLARAGVLDVQIGEVAVSGDATARAGG